MASGTDGNLITYDASGNPVAVATGDDGQILTSAGAGQPCAFEAAAGGGKIGQVLQGVGDTVQSFSSTSFTDLTSMTVDITPAATSSKILVLVDLKFSASSSSVFARLMRDSTAIYYNDTLGSRVEVFTHDNDGGYSNAYAYLKDSTAIYLDSPSTTSQITYKVQGACESGSENFYLSRTKADRDAAVNPERVVSSITVMEVLA